MNALRIRSGMAIAAVMGAGLAAPALGQSDAGGAPGKPTAAQRAASPVINTGVPARDTLLRLSRKVTVEFVDQRLEDVVTYFRDASGADIEADWQDDREQVGLEKDMLINCKGDNLPLLDLLEKVLVKAQKDAGENSWQMTEGGAIEIGPKERLNRTKRVEIYDINDLLVIIPNYYDAPQVDLQQALQASQSGGGGGGQSPFQQEQEQRQTREEQNKIKDDRRQAIEGLITSIVEPEQWQSTGGNGASITYFQGTFIVNGPDYIHRQINGYTWWPARLTRSGMSQGKRYVSLNMDAGLATVDGFTQHPVSAVVGGRLIRSNRPPGGGG